MVKNLFLCLLFVCPGLSLVAEPNAIEEVKRVESVLSQEKETFAQRVKGLAREFYESDIGNGLSVGIARVAIFGMINFLVNAAFNTSEYTIDTIEDSAVKEAFKAVFKKKEIVHSFSHIVTFFAMNKVRTKTNATWMAMFIDYFTFFSVGIFYPDLEGRELSTALDKEKN